MQIIINDAVCLKKNLSAKELLMALAIRAGNYQDTLKKMLAKKILAIEDNKYVISEQWRSAIDDLIKENSDERLLNLANKMRDCFPKGKMPGTPYFYRCNTAEVVKKLKKFFASYGNIYTDDQIIEATKRFVASFNEDFRYLPLIKYFISKLKAETNEDGVTHNVEYSPLADYLENKGDDISIAEDWITSSRN